MVTKRESSTARRKGSNSAGEKARDVILDKAIELFATHGYAGVSTRDLTTQAGVNQAAIFYHFGTKREVYIEAVLKCFNEVSGQRIERLNKLDRRSASLEDILRAFIEPHVRFVSKSSGIYYLRIFLTFSSAPEDILEELYSGHFGPVRQLFIDRISELHSDIDLDDLHRGFGMISNMIVSSLFDHGYAATRKRKPHRITVGPFVEMLISFSAAGIMSLKRSKKH